MIEAHFLRDGSVQHVSIDGAASRIPADVTWLDLSEPDGAEEKLAEEWLGIDLPTRDEMREIEPSSRLYHDEGGHFMILTLVFNADSAEPRSSAVTFVLTDRAFVTIRYADSSPFRTFRQALRRQPGLLASPADAMTALFDAIVDRLADILEKVQSDLDAISRLVFGAAEHAKLTHYDALLTRIGQNGDLVSKVRESLVSAGRVDGYARTLDPVRRNKSAAQRLAALGDDIRSLTDHATFLNDKIDFLLNATLGKINIAQSATIKIFSVVAVIFLPPTLIASIYGMNFKLMPELGWAYGYPAAIAAMAVAAVLPYWIFKKRGWL